MCAIAGILSNNTSLVNEHQLKKMTETMIHRGPDAEGHWINSGGTVGLGHRRLAILDLSEAAAQPMHYLNRYTINFNGEIYNYIELKEILFNKGYRFKSKSDTEVILAAYDCWKEDCLQQFDGMFAFAIWDNKEQLFFAARDRFGEKPFYYFEDEEQFVFSSEMKALWAIDIEKIPDDKMMLNYLALGHVQNANDKEQTFFTNIYSLPPAHYLTFSLSTFRSQIHSYWKIETEYISPVSATEATEKFMELFTTSVKRRLRSDVPLGTSLSGGLDSSSITAALSAEDIRLQSFSAVFPGFEKDESRYIQAVVDKFGIQNHQVTPTVDGLIKDFETICYHQEEPFQSSSIYAQYKVFGLAKQHEVKVLLDGQGADETLAGYHKYIHWYLQQLVSRFKFGKSAREQKIFRNNNIPYTWNLNNYVAAFFAPHTALWLEKREYKKAVTQSDINSDFVLSLRGREWEGIHKPIITKLNDILNFNTSTLGLEELLRFADRNSMAHGREVRLPFLNHELVQFLFTLPADYKIHYGWTKWLLRKAMDKKLPDEIVWRKDKVGYEPPQKQWMQEPALQEYIQEAKQQLVNRGILNAAVLNKKIIPEAAHEANNHDWRYLCVAAIL